MWLVIHLLIIAGLSARVLLRPRRGPASRTAWLRFIRASPYVGALAYLVLGRARPVSVAARPPRSARAPAPASASPGLSAADAAGSLRGCALGTSISGFPPVGGNTAQVLKDSNATIDALVADINAATDHVHLLFYIWLSDRNG